MPMEHDSRRAQHTDQCGNESKDTQQDQNVSTVDAAMREGCMCSDTQGSLLLKCVTLIRMAGVGVLHPTCALTVAKQAALVSTRPYATAAELFNRGDYVPVRCVLRIVEFGAFMVGKRVRHVTVPTTCQD